MIDRVDRVQMAVSDMEKAAKNFGDILGARVIRKSVSSYLGARRTIMALGESEVELCEPDGTGIVAAFMTKRGEGLLSAGFSTSNPSSLIRRIEGLGVIPATDGDQIYIPPEQTFGLRIVISPSRPGHRIGPVSFLYEVTHTLTSDWRKIAACHTGLLGLDPTRFSHIKSGRFGYEGTLTLFNPPDRLDRIELSQVYNQDSAMGRWGFKHGDSLYMCYCEAHDIEDIISRLEHTNSRWTPRGDDRKKEKDGLWVHPSALHGLLLGVSRTTLAWEWSGRPELVRP
ncbi:VOC family protein [Thermodesulfobacteriota bacterium]